TWSFVPGAASSESGVVNVARTPSLPNAVGTTKRAATKTTTVTRSDLTRQLYADRRPQGPSALAAAEVAQQPPQAAASQAARVTGHQYALHPASLGALAIGAHGRAHVFELALRFVHR